MSRGPGPYAVTVERGLGTTALAAVRSFADQAIAEGAAHPGFLVWTNDFAALSRRVSDQAIVGAIVFNQTERRGEIRATFAWVEPDHRRRGLFARMHHTLVLHAQCVGASGIQWETGPRAGEINSALRRAGYEIAAVRHTLQLGEV